VLARGVATKALRALLVGIFLVWVVEPLKASAFGIPAASEDATAFLSCSTGIDDCYSEMRVAHREASQVANFYSLTGGGKSNIKPDFSKLPSNLLYLTGLEIESAKVIMAGGKQWTNRLGVNNIFRKYPTLDNICCRLSLINKEKPNLITVDKKISDCEMRSVSGKEFVARKIYADFGGVGRLFRCSDGTKHVLPLLVHHNAHCGGFNVEAASFTSENGSKESDNPSEYERGDGREGVKGTFVVAKPSGKGDETGGKIVVYGTLICIAWAVFVTIVGFKKYKSNDRNCNKAD
jgi:hypothetical protein